MENIELVIQILSEYVFEIKNNIVTFKTKNYNKLSPSSDKFIKINNNFYTINEALPIPLEKQLNAFCKFLFGYVFKRVSNIMTNNFKHIFTNQEIFHLFSIKYDKEKSFTFENSEYWAQIMKESNNNIYEFLKHVKYLYDALCSELTLFIVEN